MELLNYVRTAIIMANIKLRNALPFSVMGTVFTEKDATSCIVKLKSLNRKRNGRLFTSTIESCYRSADSAADSFLRNL
jgi:hypothetical protein